MSDLLEKAKEYAVSRHKLYFDREENLVVGGMFIGSMADFAADSVKAVKLEIAEEIENHPYLALSGTHELCAWLDSLTKRLREEGK